MSSQPLQLTPEMRAALLAHPGEPLHIADEELRKVFIVIEQGSFPELEEEYVRSGLELAREQIARGKTSNASIASLIAEAQRRETLRT